MNKFQEQEYKSLVIIPMRLESQRLKQKVLLDINGISLAERSVGVALEAFQSAQGVKVLLAVSDKIIADKVQSTYPDLTVIMTDPQLASGTDRVYQAYKIFNGRESDKCRNLQTIMNLQGDMPFADPVLLRDLLFSYESLSPDEQKDTPITTLAEPWPNEIDPKLPQNVKVICDRFDRALYFSRVPLPLAHLHVGAYLYNIDAITRFTLFPQSPLEKEEKLEQLRALHHGIRIRVVLRKVTSGRSFRGIDTEEDLHWANEFSKSRGI